LGIQSDGLEQNKRRSNYDECKNQEEIRQSVFPATTVVQRVWYRRRKRCENNRFPYGRAQKGTALLF
jgi:hypothetical protein